MALVGPCRARPGTAWSAPTTAPSAPRCGRTPWPAHRPARADPGSRTRRFRQGRWCRSTPAKATAPVVAVRAESSAWSRLFPAHRARTSLQGRALYVVVLLSVTQAHRMRGLPHSRQQRREQILLGVDEVLTIVVGQLVLVGHRQRAGRAGLDAQAAADAAQVVDLINVAVALPGRVTGLVGVVPALHVDRIRRASPGAQLAPHALLQPVRVPVELVFTVKARCGDLLDLGILFGHDLLEHRREGDPETLDRIKHSHGRPPASSVGPRWSPQRTSLLHAGAAAPAPPGPVGAAGISSRRWAPRGHPALHCAASS